ncbi:di-heme oxidoredictase family protein [Pleionea sediminis]|uniref:di-heme oxidoredictase family protein n=1 Tax=Pleionea sediminis TaxID=2569479 RepID=UPI001186703E|nr:di-heme oxidoredictase family protein [Pleionea sediminis]
MYRKFKAPYVALAIITLLSAKHNQAAVVDDIELIELAKSSTPLIEHCDNQVTSQSFIDVFECGDELFETRFNALDGVGMDVGDGNRFTRVPRADLNNWLNSTPNRSTGPNAEACNVCHTTETIGQAGDGAGPAGLNVIRDPKRAGITAQFIQRNTPHLFGMAGPQLLAEEMTTELKQIVELTKQQSCRLNQTISRPLRTKGIEFGFITVEPPCLSPTVTINAEGVKNDLVIRPFQWKGNVASVRQFSRGAFHNELGMSPVEMVGEDVDGDFDGVINEITIADNTAMTLYLAGQPRPTSLLELDQIRHELTRRFGEAGVNHANELLLPQLTRRQRDSIRRGERIFHDIGCADCHRSQIMIKQLTFSEPSRHPDFRDDTFPSGQPGIDPDKAITFDITRDQPDNKIEFGNQLIKHLGAFEKDPQGRAIVRMYGDLKLHEMGPRLAEGIDETGAGSSVWMTKELWGLANTAPYLHDGRATTIEEAIIEHGGESTSSQQAFLRLENRMRHDLLAFLNNLVLYFVESEED